MNELQIIDDNDGTIAVNVGDTTVWQRMYNSENRYLAVVMAQAFIVGWRQAEEHHAWQPIETAPCDGTRVLLFVPPYGAMTGHKDLFHFKGTSSYIWNCHSSLNKEAQPTHWMPLPEPPKGDKGLSGGVKMAVEVIEEAANRRAINNKD